MQAASDYQVFDLAADSDFATLLAVRAESRPSRHISQSCLGVDKAS